MDFKRILRGPYIYILIALVGIWIGWAVISQSGTQQIDTQKGLQQLSDGKVSSVVINSTEQRVDLKTKDGATEQFYYATPRGEEVVKAVSDAGVPYNDTVQQSNWFLSLLGIILPFLIIGALFWFLLSSAQGGGSKVMQFGKSRAKMNNKENPQVSFSDVAGSDEAIEELQEIKEFLQEPAKFQAVGAKIPKGVLLYGPPGTGKTLLALAAGLAQVMDQQRYREIIMTRATVSVGEDIGFLPGTEEEKMTPWMGALTDNLEVLANPEEGGSWGRQATNDLLASRIKIRSLNFMRGRTFLSRYLIIDEAQNLTPKQMKTLITRAGPGTKIVCLGNVEQIDTPYLTETTSGLTYAVDRFKQWEHSAHVTLRRGERSRLADFASEAL